MFIKYLIYRFIHEDKDYYRCFNLKLPFEEKQFRKIVEFISRAKKEFEKNGFVVQTTRTATQPWEEYFKSKKQIISVVRKLETFTKKYGLDFFNVGTTKDIKNIPIVYEIIKNSSVGFCTVTICNNKEINFKAAEQTARLIKNFLKLTLMGLPNLRFAALFNTKPGSPFYPAAYPKDQLLLLLV